MKRSKPKYWLLLIVFLLCDISGSTAQSLPTVIPPSPETSALFKYLDYPVDYSTGVPGVSIPIYEVKSGSLSVPISLSYHAAGRKVYDQTGPVGLGWSLNAGGMVSRTVYGSPDFGSMTVGRYPFPSPFKTEAELKDRIDEADFRYLVAIEQFQKAVDLGKDQGVNTWRDSEYDVFSYSINGNSGKLVFKDSSNVQKPVFIPIKPYKVEWGSSFLDYIHITDDKGTLYQFTPGESYQQGNANVTSSWVLRNIISADKLDTVSFVYKWFYRQHFTISQHNVLKDRSTFAETTTSPGNYEFSDDYESPHMPDHGYNMPRLTEIRFKQGKVKFNLHTDIPLGSSLSDDLVKSIQIMNRKNEVIKTVEFSQARLNNISDGIRPVNKLDVIQFKDKDGQSAEKYSFEHYPVYYVSSTEIMDVRHCDWWGYYNASGMQRMVPSYTVDLISWNGTTTYETFGAASNREPKLEAARSGVIRKVTYPTGGSTEFSYGLNKYKDDAGQVKSAGGLRIEQIKTNDAFGNTYYKTFQYQSGPDGADHGFIELIPSISTMSSESKYVYIGGSSDDPLQPGGTYRERIFYSGFLPSLSVLAESPIVYPRVTEYHGTLAENTGKTVYAYDYSHRSLQPLLHVVGLTTPRFHVYSHNYWKYNALTFKEDYERVVDAEKKVTYKIRKRTNNQYGAVEKGEMKGFHVQRTHVFPQTARFGPNLSYADWYAALELYERMEIYGYRSYVIPIGVKNLLQTTETTYSDHHEPLHVSTSYAYNPRQLISEIKQISSKGNELTTRKTYPFELTSTLYQHMANNLNMVDYVIEQSELKGTTPLESIRTDYKDWGNNVIAPEVVSTRQGINSYVSRLRYKAYDRGRIATVSKEDGIDIAYLWGYNKSYPIAEARNASHGSIFHTSFEEDGTEGAGAKTGRRYHTGPYTFSPPAGFTPIPGSTLSYWSWSDLTKQWSPVEQPYSGGSVTCSGDRVDELRITPPGSQMTTYTYDPLVGVRSVTDANGKTTYYDYDAFGRLQVIKDDKGNILQAYHYNYRQ